MSEQTPRHDERRTSVLPDGWWSPQNPHRTAQRPPPASRIVDQAPPVGAPRPRAASSAARWQQSADNGSPPAGILRRIRSSPVGDFASKLLALAIFCLAIGLVITGVRAFGHFGSGNHTARSLSPTATASLPTATPSPPAQTELDGVITVQNLDDAVPFEGDVQVISADSTLLCRNAPEPKSTWHIHLTPAGVTSLPCIIAVASPSSLAPHTFRRAVAGAGGQGLVLVDNPAPFTGTTFVPTPKK